MQYLIRATRCRNEGNSEKALKLAQKSHELCVTQESKAMLEQLTQGLREAKQEEQRARMRSVFPGLSDPDFQARWAAMSARHAAESAKMKDELEAMRRRHEECRRHEDEAEAARQEEREAKAKARAEARAERAREAELEAL